MLAIDVEIADIEPDHWSGWFELLVPAKIRNEPQWALVVLDGGKPALVNVKSMATSGSRLDAADEAQRLAKAHPGSEAGSATGFAGTSSPALQKLANELDVDAVVVVEREILPELQAEIDRSLDISSDFVAQSLVILRALKKRSGKGIWSEPPLLDLLPAMSFESLQRTFDLLIPDATSMVAYVFDDEDTGPSTDHEIHSSVIAVKRKGHIDRVATHLGVSDIIDERVLARGWRTRHKELVKAVGDRYAPPSVAVFLTHSAFYRIATGPSDQLAREMNDRNVIIDPAPAWLLGLLGGATMAAFATRGARALARVLPRSARRRAKDFASTAQAVMRDSGAHPFALLGFDPIELWHRVRHFYS